MKLITKELEKKLPPLGSTNINDKIKVKLFTPDADWTWYITEYDKDTRMAFGAVDNRHGIELGYFSINEIEKVRGGYGLPVERDMYFSEQPLSNFVKLNNGKQTQQTETKEKENKMIKNFYELNSVLMENLNIELKMNPNEVYNDTFVPSVKYYNFNNQLNTVDFSKKGNTNDKETDSINLILKENNFVIVGEKIHSNSDTSRGLYPTFSNLHLITVNQYNDIKPLYQSTGDDFYNDVVLNEEGKKLIKEYSQKTINSFLTEIEKKGIEIDKEKTMIIDVSNINKEIYELKEDTENQEIKKLVIYGKDDTETFLKMKVIQEHFYPDCDITDKQFKSSAGQDWNSKIFKHGGKFECNLTPKEMVLKKEQETQSEQTTTHKRHR